MQPQHTGYCSFQRVAMPHPHSHSHISTNSYRVKLVLFTVKLRWKAIFSVLCLWRLQCPSPTPGLSKCKRTASDGGCWARSNRTQILFVFYNKLSFQVHGLRITAIMFHQLFFIPLLILQFGLWEGGLCLCSASMVLVPCQGSRILQEAWEAKTEGWGVFVIWMHG